MSGTGLTACWTSLWEAVKLWSRPLCGKLPIRLHQQQLHVTCADHAVNIPNMQTHKATDDKDSS